MYEWRAPNGVLVQSNVEQAEQGWIDRNRVIHLLWSWQFSLRRSFRTFRSRRDQGFVVQRVSIAALDQAGRAWEAELEARGIEAHVWHDGLVWRLEALNGQIQGEQAYPLSWHSWIAYPEGERAFSQRSYVDPIEAVEAEVVRWEAQNEQ